MMLKFSTFSICMIFVLGFVISSAIAQDYQPAGEEWITKWWGLDGFITDTGGSVASAAHDWLDEGTNGKLTQESASTWRGLQATKTTIVSLPDNGGNLSWTVLTIDPEDSHNMSTIQGLENQENADWYGIIVIGSPDTRTTTMHPTHDDYGHIWINGEKVYDNPEWTTGATVVTMPTEVTLKKGANVLLFRFGEDGGDDYINLHFEATDDDLKIVPTMDDEFFEELDTWTAVEPAGKLSVVWGDLKRR